MKFNVKLAAEITIKTRPVRKQFSQRLLANIRRLLNAADIAAEASLHWDLLQVQLADPSQAPDLVEILACTPGIAHFMRIEEFVLPELIAAGEGGNDAGGQNATVRAIANKVLELVGDTLQEQSFVVRCKRSGQHDFTSSDVERHVGSVLLKHSGAGGVQMRGADQTVRLEIKNDKLFVVRQRYESMGGYPLGCVAPVLSLVSGGYDSSVASFETIRRGMQTHYCFFNLGGSAHEVGVKQVSSYLWQRYGASHRTSFISVPFAEVVEGILLNVENPYMGVILKRMMYRAATRIAKAMEIDTLVTGESVSQVSSQTLKNLSVIDAATDRLVLRPLSTWDKSTIIHRANEIGVAEFAEHMPEYCAVISDKPTTAAKMERVERQEDTFDFALLDRAVESRKMISIDKIYQPELAVENVEIQATPLPQQVVVDLRSPDEQEKAPLVLHSNETLSIPFYKINRLFNQLDPSRSYLLYCDHGVMSKLHAVHLRAEGFSNVSVYRPE